MNIESIYKIFLKESDCIAHLELIRWNKVPKCPHCQSINSTPMGSEFRHHCNCCKSSYSVTVRTIFHKTHLPLQKWFLAISLILNSYKSISARKLAKDLGINKNTAWRISEKIRNAMFQGQEREFLIRVIQESKYE